MAANPAMPERIRVDNLPYHFSVTQSGVMRGTFSLG